MSIRDLRLKRILFVYALILIVFALSGCSQKGREHIKSDCPRFSPEGGFYRKELFVSIKCKSAREIYYTILKPSYNEDGSWNEYKWRIDVQHSLPDTSSTLYKSPFRVDSQCIIRAMAVKYNGEKVYSMTAFDFDMDRDSDFINKKSCLNPVSPLTSDLEKLTVYSILIDKFFDGDSFNNKDPFLTDQDGELFDETLVFRGQKDKVYQGGDLRGITQKLKYIKDMGFTAIEISNPCKNLVFDGVDYGYSGRSPSNFTQVDFHYGSMDDYQELVDKAHKMGIYVLQDVIITDIGDYQQIKDGDFKLKKMSVPLNHPEMLPWAFNNIENLTQDELKYFSFYSYVTDTDDRRGDDIALDNTVVYSLIKGYLAYWIDKAGIDGLCLKDADTIDKDLIADLSRYLKDYAIDSGKSSFICIKDISNEYKKEDITSVIKSQYTKSIDQSNAYTQSLIMSIKNNPSMVKALYNLIYTLPGIPIVKSGSEQGGTEVLLDESKFDTYNTWYTYFKSLNTMRSENSIFTDSHMEILKDRDSDWGLFAFLITRNSKGDEYGSKAVYVVNDSSSARVLNASSTLLKSGEEFELLSYPEICTQGIGDIAVSRFFTIEGNQKGYINLIVPPLSCAVYLLTESRNAEPDMDITLTIDQIPLSITTDDKVLSVTGRCSADGNVKLVINGDYSLSEGIEVIGGIPFEVSTGIEKLSGERLSCQLIYTDDNGVRWFSILKSVKLQP